jgi:hypothetical protein
LIGIAVLSQAPAAFAQGSASGSITAQAFVLTPVSVTPEQDLDFGNVIPGTNKSVQITGATAGRWLVEGTGGAEVDLDFTALPATLSNGPDALAIFYSNVDAGHNTVNVPGGATVFDPAVGTTTDIGAPGGDLYVWIGGTVVPAGAQPA